MKRILAITLCAAMLLLVLAACATDEFGERGVGQSVDDPVYGTGTPEDPNPPSVVNLGDTAWDEAFATFAPDTVMITAGDYTVTWADLFFHLRSLIQGVGGPNVNPGEIVHAFGEFLLDDATESALAFRAIEYGAATHNVQLDAAALAEIQQSIDAYMEMMELETEEEFLQSIWEAMGYYSRDLLEYTLQKSYLAQTLFQAIYGVNGAELPDETVRELIEQDGYLMAMHILIMGHDDPTAEAERIHALLEAYDGDNFTAYFAELMFQYSEDLGGLQGFPHGYVFQFGDMVPEFYAGTQALEIGGLSPPVASQFGYHIIHRLPIDYDVVPISMADQAASLRHIVAMTRFDMDVQGWLRDLNPQFTAAFESIDLHDLFCDGHDDDNDYG